MYHSGPVRAACLVLAMVSLVSAPALAQEKWQGPGKGPPVQTGKTVVYIASDFRNGSVGTVYRGLQEAAQKLGWTTSVVDGGGLKDRQADALTAAIAGNAQAIVFG